MGGACPGARLPIIYVVYAPVGPVLAAALSLAPPSPCSYFTGRLHFATGVVERAGCVRGVTARPASVVRGGRPPARGPGVAALRGPGRFCRFVGLGVCRDGGGLQAVDDCLDG